MTCQFLKLAMSRQFCDNLLAHPRRKLIHEGSLAGIGIVVSALPRLRTTGSTYVYFRCALRIHDEKRSSENQKNVDFYAFLFNDMFLLTKIKKGTYRNRIMVFF